jgi:hypothetical protein
MRRAITIAVVSSLAPLGACGEDKAVTLSKCTQKAIKKKVVGETRNVEACIGAAGYRLRQDDNPLSHSAKQPKTRVVNNEPTRVAAFFSMTRLEHWSMTTGC